MMAGWIGVDLDGTLAHYDGWKGVGHVGKPIKPMCDRVRSWLANGQEVRIFTARVTEVKSHIPGAAEAARAGVTAAIDAFSVDQFGVALQVTNIKDFGMIELWDDRAIQVRPNTGERI